MVAVLSADGSMDDIFRELGARPTVTVEYPRGAMVKRRVNGSVDFVSPLPCPYNYESIHKTQPNNNTNPNMVVLGPRLKKGTRLAVPVVAVVDFWDNGQEDPKVVCSTRSLRRLDLPGIAAFFTIYAVAKRALALARGQQGETAFRGFVPEARWRVSIKQEE